MHTNKWRVQEIILRAWCFICHHSSSVQHLHGSNLEAYLHALSHMWIRIHRLVTLTVSHDFSSITLVPLFFFFFFPYISAMPFRKFVVCSVLPLKSYQKNWLKDGDYVYIQHSSEHAFTSTYLYQHIFIWPLATISRDLTYEWLPLPSSSPHTYTHDCFCIMHPTFMQLQI